MFCIREIRIAFQEYCSSILDISRSELPSYMANQTVLTRPYFTDGENGTYLVIQQTFC